MPNIVGRSGVPSRSARIRTRELMSACGTDDAEKARRARLLQHLQSTSHQEPVELARYSLERKRKLSLEAFGESAVPAHPEH